MSCFLFHNAEGIYMSVCILQYSSAVISPSSMQLAQDSHIEVYGAGGIAFDIGFEGASEKYYQQPAGRATLTRLAMDVATQQAR